MHYMFSTWVARPIMKDQPSEDVLFGEFYDGSVTSEQGEVIKL